MTKMNRKVRIKGHYASPMEDIDKRVARLIDRIDSNTEKLIMGMRGLKIKVDELRAENAALKLKVERYRNTLHEFGWTDAEVNVVEQGKDV